MKTLIKAIEKKLSVGLKQIAFSQAEKIEDSGEYIEHDEKSYSIERLTDGAFYITSAEECNCGEFVCYLSVEESEK